MTFKIWFQNFDFSQNAFEIFTTCNSIPSLKGMIKHSAAVRIRQRRLGAWCSRSVTRHKRRFTLRVGDHVFRSRDAQVETRDLFVRSSGEIDGAFVAGPTFSSMWK